MGLGATADFDRFQEALDWYGARVTMSAEDAKAIAAHARWQAWWLSDVAQARMVQDVQDSITKALASGADYKTWQKEAVEQLSNAWSLEGEAAAFRVETIWRNAAQNAYSRGRYEQMTKPLTMKVRPFWLYDAMMDGRTSDICSRLNGTVLAADDPWWDAHYPPSHHRCRSTVRALRESEAKRRGISQGPPLDEDGAEVDAQDGFGWSPKAQGALEDIMSETLDGFDDELADAVSRKYRARKDDRALIDLGMGDGAENDEAEDTTQ